MRREQSSFERAAWSLLRNRGILRLKFRRQHIVAGFIVDFACLGAKVILEVDSPHHDNADQNSYDVSREVRLRAAGFTVIRIRPRELSATLWRGFCFRLHPLSRRERGQGGEDTTAEGEGGGEDYGR